jgi:hypothetical protein
MKKTENRSDIILCFGFDVLCQTQTMLTSGLIHFLNNKFVNSYLINLNRCNAITTQFYLKIDGIIN